MLRRWFLSDVLLDTYTAAEVPVPENQPEVKVCRNCGPQPLDKWRQVKKTAAKSGFSWRCIVCTRRANIKVYKKDPAKRRENTRRWCEKNPEKKKAADSAWKREHSSYRRDYTKKGNRAFREQVLFHYGGEIPACACPSGTCGETRIQFLCLDHIGGGGNAHRAKVGGGSSFYRWIVKNGFPVGFRVLCHNCNMAMGFYGRCPHQTPDT
jgi:hypothetical protein